MNIKPAKKPNCYTVTFHDEKFYVDDFHPTTSKSAKHKMDARSICLMKDNKFFRLSKSNKKDRTIHYAIVDAMTKELS
jgi:hypothetical protein